MLRTKCLTEAAIYEQNKRVEKNPAPSGNCRCPGDNVRHFLCAKALQQTHILPAKLMPSLRTTPSPRTKKKSFPGEEMATERDAATSAFSVLGSRFVQN